LFKQDDEDYLNEQQVKDYFAEDYTNLQKHWEILNPLHTKLDQVKDYHWLSQVYQSLQPSTGEGLRVWRRLGPKTSQAINENVELEEIKDDLDVLVMDENLFQKINSGQTPHSAEAIEIRIIRRLKKHGNEKEFVELGQKLEDIKKKFNKTSTDRVEWLKAIIKIANQVVDAEKERKEIIKIDHKEALTRIFNQYKTKDTPLEIEEIVTEIDEIVKEIRFDGWQETIAGEQEIQKKIFSILMKYDLHGDTELFERIYDYIKKHY